MYHSKQLERSLGTASHLKLLLILLNACQLYLLHTVHRGAKQNFKKQSTEQGKGEGELERASEKEREREREREIDRERER
jgi:hypothetical protein